MKWKRKSWDPQTDQYWGPFTYNSDSLYRGFGFCLYSADNEDEDDAGCQLGRAGLRLHLGRRCLILTLPGWVCPPRRTKVVAKGWDAATVDRLGRNWYWDVTRREFGVALTKGGENGYDYLSVEYGVQTYDSSTDKSWSWFLPWKQWHMVRHTFYADNGTRWYDAPCPGPRYGTPEYDLVNAEEANVPTRIFAFLDYDGEHLYATTRIEEREWHRGEGWWRWLRHFYKPMIRRSLNLRFSGVTGQRKGSWKGGTIGHGIDLQPGELHMGGFMRYCQEHDMKFLFEVNEIPPNAQPHLRPCPTEPNHLCCYPSCNCAKEREPQTQG